MRRTKRVAMLAATDGRFYQRLADEHEFLVTLIAAEFSILSLRNKNAKMHVAAWYPSGSSSVEVYTDLSKMLLV